MMKGTLKEEIEQEEKAYLSRFSGLRRRALARRKIRELRESHVTNDKALTRYASLLRRLESNGVEEEESTSSSYTEIIVFTLIFAVYLKTVYPTISGGDSGELVVAAYNLGAAHPPGYPTWTLLTALAVRIPVGTSIAWRANVLSCCLDAAAASLICLTVRKRTKSAAGGMFAAGLFAFSPTIWLYACQAEVFALNNFLVALVLYLYDQFESESSIISTARWGTFVCALALTNQHTTLFLVAPIALRVLYRLHFEKRILTWNIFTQLFCCGLLGLSPYLYLPITTAMKVKDGWGDMTTMQGFLRHFLRQEYGTFQLTDGGVDDSIYVWYRLADYVRSVFLEEGLIVALPLACFGVFYQPTKRNVLPIVCFAIHLGVLSYLANMDTNRALMRGVYRRFWQQANVHLFIWCGDGFALIMMKSMRRRTRWWIGMFVAFILVLSQLLLNFESRDFHDSDHIRLYGERVLQTLPRDSILLITEDLNNNAIKYVQECEGVRPDVSSLSVPLMTYEWWAKTQTRHYPNVVIPNEMYHPGKPNGYSILEFLLSNTNRFPVFIAGSWYDNDPSHENIYLRHSYGFVDRILPLPEIYNNAISLKNPKTGKEKQFMVKPAFPIRDFQEYVSLVWKGIPILTEAPPGEESRYDEESWEHELRKKYYANMINLANFLSTSIPRIAFTNVNMDEEKIKELRLRLAAALFTRSYRWICSNRNTIMNDFLGRDSTRLYIQNTGTIYGQLSAMTSNITEKDWMSMYMYHFWKIAQNESISLNIEMEPGIKYYVEQAINPYLGNKLSDSLRERALRAEFLDESLGLFSVMSL